MIFDDMDGMDTFRSRITELADRAYARGIVLFSDFLDLNQQNALHAVRWKDHGVRPRTFGGYPLAERQMAAFVPDALSFSGEETDCPPNEAAPGWPFPVSLIRIKPSAPRYAEALSHRDFLGSVLSLGIERSKIGDLLVCGQTAQLICVDHLADFICRELTRVRHTEVSAAVCSGEMLSLQPETEARVGSVASLRLDALIGLAFGIPRSRASELVQGGAVFVNARLVTSNGHPPREGDRISVRGLGKCRFSGVLHQTKKGRIMVQMDRYI